ncbi:MAG: GTPase HflX [Candidatus Brocadiia bacterium]
MVDLKRTELSVRAERAILLQVYRKDRETLANSALEELADLARSARANVIGEVRQQRNNPDSRYYIGSGKVREVSALCQAKDADIVICDDDLKPSQVKNLESSLDTKVVDRSELILGIFAQHARTMQSKLQVELAQLEYAFPRLKKMWTHLDRMAGGTIAGGIGVRGPGEKQLEVDRRLVQKRISELKEKLEKIEDRHQRAAEDRNKMFTTVALVGYTNAGKSTLMNLLTKAGVTVKDQLFETLDTRTREWDLPDGRSVMLSDTVGFIRKLPHHLVASFHATLEEAREADLLFHVCDAAAETAAAQIEAVDDVLEEIGCGNKPRVLILNKTDILKDEMRLPLLEQKAETAIPMSARNGHGLEELAETMQSFLDEKQVEIDVEFAVGNGRLFSFLYENGLVLDESYTDGKAQMRVRVPEGLPGIIKSMGGCIHVVAGSGS